VTSKGARHFRVVLFVSCAYWAGYFLTCLGNGHLTHFTGACESWLLSLLALFGWWAFTD
jgi:hypothetical protein